MNPIYVRAVRQAFDYMVAHNMGAVVFVFVGQYLYGNIKNTNGHMLYDAYPTVSNGCIFRPMEGCSGREGTDEAAPNAIIEWIHENQKEARCRWCGEINEKTH